MRARRQLERERLYTLFAVPTSMFIWLFYEIGRRQRIGEAHDEERRRYVDEELTTLNRTTLEARAKAEGAAEAGKARIESSNRKWTTIGVLAAIAGVLVVVKAYHLFGA